MSNENPLKNTKRIRGYDVYHSPEFKALCDLIGLKHDLATIEVTIRLTENQVIISQDYQARVKKTLEDTTTLHNEKYRSCAPVSDEPFFRETRD